MANVARQFLAIWAGSTAMMLGCTDDREVKQRAASDPARELVSKTFYLDGAGNYGFGTSSIPAGLKQGGVRGDVEVYVWTNSFNFLVDQRTAGLKAGGLRERIVAYARRYPGRPINIIALSAGTGVTTWAVEKLPADVMVDNLVFLGSSLSSEYDLTRMLQRVRGKVHCYYSGNDSILASAIVTVGTVDGKWWTECIGQAGARLPDKPSAATRQLYAAKVVNHPWTYRFAALGYDGDHTGATSAAFVAKEIAPKLTPSEARTRNFVRATGVAGKP